MPSPPATPAPHAASCFAKEAVRQGRPEPPLPPFQPHPSPRLRQIKGGLLQPHQASRAQELLMGGEVSSVATEPDGVVPLVPAPMLDVFAIVASSRCAAGVWVEQGDQRDPAR